MSLRGVFLFVSILPFVFLPKDFFWRGGGLKPPSPPPLAYALEGSWFGTEPNTWSSDIKLARVCRAQQYVKTVNFIVAYPANPSRTCLSVLYRCYHTPPTWLHLICRTVRGTSRPDSRPYRLKVRSVLIKSY